MTVFLYNIFLWLFKGGIYIAALFNRKAEKWVQGRKHIFKRLKEAIPESEKIIWVHCASLGEFEQGRPVIEQLKNEYPGYKILLTFFSPSGYETQKNYQKADWVFYLPVDGSRNAKKFLEIVKPSLVIFVKYEFWYFYLKKIKYRHIPLLLISASFRKDMLFFKWYGTFQRKMLTRFNHLFVQNLESKNLADSIGLQNKCTVSGDTRFDRVIEIAEKFEAIPIVENFISSRKVVIAGSTWPADEEALQQCFSLLSHTKFKLIIAPHEINEVHIAEIKKLFPGSVRFSELNKKKVNENESNCLIIDNIGMLSRLYKYATIAYIGGGLKKGGVHNVLEAAVYNKPVIFGPHYQKYSEATGLILSGGGFSFINEKNDGIVLSELMYAICKNDTIYKKISGAAGEFVQNNKGATKKIMAYIQENRLLTN